MMLTYRLDGPAAIKFSTPLALGHASSQILPSVRFVPNFNAPILTPASMWAFLRQTQTPKAPKLQSLSFANFRSEPATTNLRKPIV